MDKDVLALVLQARTGDADAFARLIERFERTALATAFGQLHDGHRAGDAVQEAFLRAWQELPRLQEPERFGGWLLQIVRHAAIDMRRRIRPTVGEFGELRAQGSGPAGEAEATDRARKVKEALGQLDETTRTAVVMRYYEGLSAREIGEDLEMSPAAVDMRLSRARAQLRDILAPVVEQETGSNGAGASLRRAHGERA